MNVEIDALATRFFTAIAAADIATVEQIYADDVQVWHNMSNSAQNKQENLKVLRGLVRMGSIRYEVLERMIVGNRVAQRHILHVQLRNGGVFAIPAGIFLTINDGRVAHIDEYLDSAHSNALVQAAAGK